MDLKEIEQRMRPGGWNTKPMLLPGQSLESIIAEDTRRLATLQVSNETLGTKLGELLEKGRETDWFRPFRQSGIDVEVRRRRGFITCPWAEEEFEKCTVGKGGRATANEFFIRNRKSSHSMQGFELSVHLIRDHGFFGGPDTPFRIEPDELVGILTSQP
jgi:hypothetical protein